MPTASPATALELRKIRVGDGALTLRLRREGDNTLIDQVEHPSLRIEQGTPPAPLWGAPAAR